MKKMLLIVVILFLSACGPKTPGSPGALEGTYVSNRTTVSLVFKSNGLVSKLNDGVFQVDLPYKLDGDQIIVKGLPSALTLNKDGSIDGGLLAEIFIKK